MSVIIESFLYPWRVTKKDLRGDIEDIPLEIVKEMCLNQLRQGNPADVTVFYDNPQADRMFGGFDWCDTKEGEAFWTNVIVNKMYIQFFKRKY